MSGTNDSLQRGLVISSAGNTLHVGKDGGIPTTLIERRRSAQGDQFFASYRWTGIADGSSVYLHTKTPTGNKVDAVVTIEVEGKGYFDMFENPTLTGDGTALTVYCTNRDDLQTTNVEVFRDPTVTDDGTNLEQGQIGSAGKFTLAGGKRKGSAYWFFDDDQSYLKKVTNKSGGSADIVMNVAFRVCKR